MNQPQADESFTANLYRAWIKNASDILTVVDESGVIVYESASVQRVLGYDPQERRGAEVFATVHPDDLVRARETFQNLLVHPGVPFSAELRNRRKDGSWCDLELVGQASADAAGHPRIFVIGRDITERKRVQAERARREEQQRTAQKMEAIGRLAGGIAHEYNNLLTTILGHADLGLGALPPSHPVRRNLEQVKASGQRAATLTRQLLAFGRRQILQPRVISLNAVVAATAEMLRPLIGEDVQVVLELPEGLSAVKADPGQLEQVLINLALNARDAMPRGGILTLTTAETEVDGAAATRLGLPPGDYVRLTIADTGAGIPPEVFPRLFEPFFTTKEVGKGTGLGLSTVYGIVRQSGGGIEVENAVPTGAVFRVYLPRTSEELHTPARPPVAAPPVRPALLVVEDEPSVRELVCEVLSGEGYPLLQAADGAAALELADQYAGEILLLVTDVVLPRVQGPELLERLRAKRPAVKALFMSGHSDDVRFRHGVQDASIPFLPKPFSPDALLTKVRELLSSPASPRGA